MRRPQRFQLDRAEVRNDVEAHVALEILEAPILDRAALGGEPRGRVVADGEPAGSERPALRLREQLAQPALGVALRAVERLATPRATAGRARRALHRHAQIPDALGTPALDLTLHDSSSFLRSRYRRRRARSRQRSEQKRGSCPRESAFAALSGSIRLPQSLQRYARLAIDQETP